MRKQNLLFCTLLLLSLSSGISAQYFGARIGLNATNASFEAASLDIDTEGETNLMLGIFLDLPLGGDLISVQPELNYLNRGFATDTDANTFSTDLTTSYVDLGAILKFNILRDAPVGVYLGVGPYFSYAVSGQITDANGERDIDFDADRLNRTGLQITGLGGVTFGADLKFFAEIRYNGTISDLSDQDDVDINQNLIGISGGIMVPLN